MLLMVVLSILNSRVQLQVDASKLNQNHVVVKELGNAFSTSRFADRTH